MGNKDNFRKMPNASEIQAMLSKLVQETLDAYGNVGIYDPEMLAEIDFLNQPELLVDLVSKSKGRESREHKCITQHRLPVPPPVPPAHQPAEPPADMPADSLVAPILFGRAFTAAPLRCHLRLTRPAV